MLSPAILHKEELNTLFASCYLNPHYKFYNVDENVRMVASIDETTWNGHQFVSIGKAQKILGYMSASVDRGARFVNNLSLISFDKNAMTFIRDFQRFLWRLISYHNYRKIKWSVTCGSPHEKTYDKLCVKYGGRIVGVFEKENLLEDGQLYNVKYYEIMSDKLIENGLPVVVKLHNKGIKIPEYSGEV